MRKLSFKQINKYSYLESYNFSKLEKNFIKINSQRSKLLTINEFSKILKEEKFKKYFLSGGSLLGLIRDNNFIPGDDDIDFACASEDLSGCITKLQKKFIKNNFIARTRNARGFVKLNLYKNGNKISLQSYKKKNQWRVTSIVKLPGKDFEKIKKKTFLNIKVNIPKNAENYLEHVYGMWKIKNSSNFFYTLKYYKHDTFYSVYRKLSRILRVKTD